MSSKDDRKQAADIIKNAMMSRSDSDDKNSERLSTEDALLLRMQQAMRDLERPSYPSKRRQRKVRRLVTKGNQAALRQTGNYVKQVYTSSAEAQRSYIYVYPEISTREVGPGDRYNSDYGLHGKETGPRG